MEECIKMAPTPTTIVELKDKKKEIQSGSGVEADAQSQLLKVDESGGRVTEEE